MITVIAIFRIIRPNGKLVIFRIRVEYNLVRLAIPTPVLHIDIHLLHVDRGVVVSRHLQCIGVFHSRLPFMVPVELIGIFLPVNGKTDRRFLVITVDGGKDCLHHHRICIVQMIVAARLQASPA